MYNGIWNIIDSFYALREWLKNMEYSWRLYVELACYEMNYNTLYYYLKNMNVFQVLYIFSHLHEDLMVSIYSLISI